MKFWIWSKPQLKNIYCSDYIVLEILKKQIWLFFNCIWVWRFIIMEEINLPVCYTT